MYAAITYIELMSCLEPNQGTNQIPAFTFNLLRKMKNLEPCV